jgi:hypothetical protein
MPIVGIWFHWQEGVWAGGNALGSWTVDVEFGPSTIYAFSNLSSLLTIDTGDMTSGVQSYRTTDPNTQQDTEHDVGSGLVNNVAPAVFDSNVTMVTFGYAITAATYWQADVIFHVFFWG